MNNLSKSRIAIIGGGAAGFFAAANLAELCPQAEISIFESGSKFLAKVEVSGGGRCNVTNSCFDVSELIKAYPRGSQELRGPFSRFSTSDTVEWFARHGVELKAESDGRMFPITDSSQTIIDCLKSYVDSGKVQLKTSMAVKSIVRNGETFSLNFLNSEEVVCDFVMLCSGSSKSGYGLASSLGHNITECAPSLFTFKISDPRLEGLSGISFSSVALTLSTTDSPTFKQEGPLLITHWGLSGPAVLKLSAYAARELARSRHQAKLSVNWIPGYNETRCREIFSSLRKKMAKKEIGSNPQFNLTKRFWENLLKFCDIPNNLHFFELSNEQVTELTSTLLRSEFSVEGKGEFKEEFVTCGGIDLKQIDFRHFESKIVPNLYFAGEILDIDAITGGFNFQAAWTGAWIVANTIAERVW